MTWKIHSLEHMQKNETRSRENARQRIRKSRNLLDRRLLTLSFQSRSLHVLDRSPDLLFPNLVSLNFKCHTGKHKGS